MDFRFVTFFQLTNQMMNASASGAIRYCLSFLSGHSNHHQNRFQLVHKHLKDVDSNKNEDSGQHSPTSISPKRSTSDSDADIVHSPKRSRKESKSPEDTFLV
jgi:hypothetical protein